MGFLTGYRVLDLSDERGMLAGRILADLGADVVQVEPPTGNSARYRAPAHTIVEEELPNSFVWEAFAANKRGFVADVETNEGQQKVRKLAKHADILIETDGSRLQAYRGLDYDDLKELNPNLVYISITAFGRSGPKADYSASDITIWAAGGPLDEHRQEGVPLRPSIPQAFLHAAADAAAAGQLALLAREEIGKGQLVDISAQASLGIATLGRVLTHVSGDHPREMFKGMRLEAQPVDQSGSGSATPPSQKKWRCRDGLIEFHLSVGPATGRFTNNFIKWMTLDGIDLGKFAEIDFRLVPEMISAGEFTQEDIVDLRDRVGAFLATTTKSQVLEAAVRHKLLCVPIFDTSDVRDSIQLQSRDFWVTVGHGERKRTLPGPFAKVTADAFDIRRPAPTLGEHTQEVWHEWGSSNELQRSRELASTQGIVDHSPARLPLEGLKVLDFSWVIAGPVISRALADFGATVIRVESPTRPETARVMHPFYGGESGPENSALFGTWNAGKLGITLDLNTDEGLEVARDLTQWADVILESFSPGLLKRWGLDYESLVRDRPDLIMLSSSLNGQTGPLAKMAGFGNIGAALSGFQTIVGAVDGPPIGPFGPYTDFVAPRFGLSALLGALELRKKTGKGCYIDLSQVEAGVWMQAPEMVHHTYDGTIVQRIGNADREFAPHGVFPCAGDGTLGIEAQYIAVAITTDEQWRALCNEMQRPDLLRDPGLQSSAGRLSRASELEKALGAWTQTLPGMEAERRLQAIGVPAHISANSEDFCTDPQLIHRGHLVEVEHPKHGTVTVEGPRYILSETPGRVHSAAPLLGQHNEYVFAEILKYSQEFIQRLSKSSHKSKATVPHR